MTATILSIVCTVGIALIGLLIKMVGVESKTTAILTEMRRELDENRKEHTEIFQRLRDVEWRRNKRATVTIGMKPLKA